VSALLDEGAGTSPEPEPGSEPVTGVADGSLAGLRSKPSTIGGAIYLLVVAATAVGLGIVEWGPWRLGIKIIGVAVLVAAAARACLSNFNSGMLRVRSKPFDLVLLVTLGVLLIVLAIVVPNQTA